MARPAFSPCRDFTCGALVEGGGYCPKHQPKRVFENRPQTKRKNSTARGYGRAWQSARRTWLNLHPLCVSCERVGRTEPANVVDHIQDHKGDKVKFWDRSNWQSLCHSCHSRKTFKDNKAAITGARS